jgi:hypothetical protein
MRTSALVGTLVLVLAACGTNPEKPTGHISVDHILIGVSSPRFPTGKRSQTDARAFAHDLFAKLRAGGDWAAAKREHSEDPPPGGPYGMADRGLDPAPGEVARDDMVPAFGDVGFSLSVGEIGLAEYDPAKSPYGFHLIKRVE